MQQQNTKNRTQIFETQKDFNHKIYKSSRNFLSGFSQKPNYEATQKKKKTRPVVRALIIPALRPLKSLKTSSTVRGLYCAPPPTPSIFSPSLSLFCHSLSLSLSLRGKPSLKSIEIENGLIKKRNREWCGVRV